MKRKLYPESDFDGVLYVDARWWKLGYNMVKIVWLWITRKRRAGHWYFDA